jgi:hypothetical protein
MGKNMISDFGDIRLVCKRASILTLFLLQSCSPHYAYKEKAVPEPIVFSERLRSLFANTKLVCFGRFALEVPREAELVWGGASFPSRVTFIRGGQTEAQRQIKDDISKILSQDKTAQITYNDFGPVKGSWQIRYYEDETSIKYNLHFFKTYVNFGDLTYVLDGSLGKRTEKEAAAKQALRAQGLRLRAPDEVPTDQGYCIEHAFMAEDLYDNQEMVNIGIHLPSLPDVAFSVSSNKDAYSDYPKDEFENTKRAELSLLGRIEAAKKDQLFSYPSRVILREGKRDVHHWHGEESLYRRKDGTHDFEWALVGTPGDVANPSEFSVGMYTKVRHNIVGAAEVASVTDDEAVALFDKLLSGLKFRVKVPNAPHGSYYTAEEIAIATSQPKPK